MHRRNLRVRVTEQFSGKLDARICVDRGRNRASKQVRCHALDPLSPEYMPQLSTHVPSSQRSAIPGLEQQRVEVEAADRRKSPTDRVGLSILQFAKFRLWKDLDDNWEELANNPLVHHLIHSPTSEFQDPNADSQLADLDELGALSPVAADSSQLSAVAAAVGGRTFVLEGPPGTGKSQTITNLPVRAVADGKKVLFVAEKRAALEVVQRRLEEVGLGPFALDLHDKGSRPAAVRAQIKAALQHRVSSDSDGLRAATETLESSRRTLSRYSQRLHEANGAGLSYYSARNRLLSAPESTPALTVPGSLVSGDPTAVEAVRLHPARLTGRIRVDSHAIAAAAGASTGPMVNRTDTDR